MLRKQDRAQDDQNQQAQQETNKAQDWKDSSQNIEGADENYGDKMQRNTNPNSQSKYT